MTALEEIKTAFAGQFMQPRCYLGKDIQFEIMEAGLDMDDEGYYCRLSADGYLDCTDLSGPYQSLEAAAQALLDMYGDE
jgi:hypothetical protein